MAKLKGQLGWIPICDARSEVCCLARCSSAGKSLHLRHRPSHNSKMVLPTVNLGQLTGIEPSHGRAQLVRPGSLAQAPEGLAGLGVLTWSRVTPVPNSPAASGMLL